MIASQKIAVSVTANFVSLIVLAGLTVLIPFASTVRLVEWFAILIMLLAVALYVWSRPWAPEKPNAWLRFAGKTVLLALGAFGCLRAWTLLIYMGDTEAAGSMAVDIALSACISPGMTVIAIAGAARTKYLIWMSERSTCDSPCSRVGKAGRQAPKCMNQGHR